MHDLFNDDGCLTACAFSALADDSLDELSRLEVAEHLSFCDKCIDAYSDFLANDSLISPPKPMANTVMMRIRMKALSFFSSKYFSAAVAACLAFTLWCTGAFDIKFNDESRIKTTEAISSSTSQLAEGVNSFSAMLGDGLTKAYGDIKNFDLKGVFINDQKK